MRQTHICAWLLVTSSFIAACGGEKFVSSDSSNGGSETPSVPATAGSSSHHTSSGGSTAGSYDRSSGGTSATSSGGTSSVGGTGSSTGGSTSSAGASSTAGSATTGGGDSSDACPSGSITFRMVPGPDLASDYLCDAGCGTGWLTITDDEGAMAYSIFSACGTASCDSCEVQPCAAAACLPTPLTAEGSELVWTGQYLAKSTCGAINMACQESACVKPGKYKAKACAAVNGGPSAMGAGCTPKSDVLCAEAEFDFPATTTVQLVLKK